MNKQLLIKIKESLFSVLPITVIVILLSITRLVPLESGMLIKFIGSALFLILGMGLFTLGADLAMMPIGEHVGASLTKSRKLSILIVVIFILGLLITMAEPDLQVLASQVPLEPNILFVIIVGIGVGIFLVISLLRIIFKKSLSLFLIVFYISIFTLAIIMIILEKTDFLSMAFDSGGVTTGPITVPFIMALGTGVASVNAGKSSREDSFGLVGLSSIGPILAVLIVGLISSGLPEYEATDVLTLKENIILHIKDITVALAPIILFFIAFQFINLKLSKKKIIKILIGILYTYLGLIIFLTVIMYGFLPVGQEIGKSLGSSDHTWALIPLGLIIGFVVVFAEPAVHVLNKQVEEVSDGSISRKSMLIGLSTGVGISIALSMVRIIFDFSIIWYLIPGYAIALGLTFFVPKIYTAIAFDSGGVASGPMASTFILPLAIGACETVAGVESVLTLGFGVVAMIAMAPLITIQLLGFSAVMKEKNRAKIDAHRVVDVDDEQIINF